MFRPLVFWSLFSVTMGFVMGGTFVAALLSAPRQHTEHHQLVDKCSAEESKKHGFWEKAGCDPVAHFTLWLVGFTGVLAVSTIGLWIVTWRVGRNQSSDTRVLQRAYVAVGGGGIDPLAHYCVAHIVVRNVGQLPARDLSWFINAEFDQDGRRNVFEIEDDSFYGNNIVSPGTEMARSHNFPGWTDVLDEFRGGNCHVYVWGEIRYTDGFGERRYTRFCHRYDRRGIVQHLTDFASARVQTAVSDKVTGESMRYHQFGNDAD